MEPDLGTLGYQTGSGHQRGFTREWSGGVRNTCQVLSLLSRGASCRVVTIGDGGPQWRSCSSSFRLKKFHQLPEVFSKLLSFS